MERFLAEVPAARAANGMADFAKRSNGRLIPLAVVPPVASQEVYDEFDRCRKVLVIRNIQMTTVAGITSQ